MKIIVQSIIAVAASFVCAVAASITHTATVFQTSGDWTFTNSVPQFDPALGTLTNVSVSISINVTNDIYAENIGSRKVTPITQGDVLATVTVAGFSVEANVINSHSQSLTTFDGVIDYSGTSGFTKTVSGNDSVLAVFPSAGFVGSGSVTLVASIVTSAIYQGIGAYNFGVTTTSSALVTVTYDFTPNCPPCEDEEDCKPSVKPPSKDNDCDGDDRRNKSRRNRR